MAKENGHNPAKLSALPVMGKIEPWVYRTISGTKSGRGIVLLLCYLGAAVEEMEQLWSAEKQIPADED